MVACFIFNALEAAGTIVWATIKQWHVPLALLGPVSSLDWLISIGLLPMSFALTAPLAGLVGARTTLVAPPLSARSRQSQPSSFPLGNIEGQTPRPDADTPIEPERPRRKREPGAGTPAQEQPQAPATSLAETLVVTKPA